MPNSASGPFWCVSLNPAIDKRMRVPRLITGGVNRVSEVRAEPGGKAAHVAMVLGALGADPIWLGFAGGSMGQQLLSGLRGIGIRTEPVMVCQDTRVNLEIIDDDGGVTEILEPGTEIEETDWELFFRAFEKLLAEGKKGGTVIASGSLPRDADAAVYQRLTESAHSYGHKMFVDTGGEPMRIALSAKPDLIKPNRDETEWLLGKEIVDCIAAKNAAQRLCEMGAQSVVVSMGSEGFVFQPGMGQEGYYVKPASVAARSSVGAGDATMAALAYGLSERFEMEKTLRLAAACGAANCVADAPARVRMEDVVEFEGQVRIEKLA
jgi:1-phosphofructokinase family hexose kinase